MHGTIKTPTVSLKHQAIADWHYMMAMRSWSIYSKLLNDKGLLDPGKLMKAKSALSVFRRHMQIGDVLMKRPGASYQQRQVQYQPREEDRKRWADDFEFAVIQRGQQAKANAEAQTETIH